jgi:hypothetical protein
MSEPTPAPVQKRGPGCVVESLHGVLRVKEPGAPLTVFAIVRLSPEELVAHYGRVPDAPVDFDLVSYVNCNLLWNRLRERGGQTLVDEVRGAIGLDLEAVSRARAAKESEEIAKRPPSQHAWQIDTAQPNSQFCRRCGANEDGGPCRSFVPGDLEGMCAHDSYRNEACAKCGRDAEKKTPKTKEDIRKLVIDHNAVHPGKSKVIFDEAAFDDLLKFHDPTVVDSLYDSTQEAIEVEELVFSGVPFEEALRRVHGTAVQFTPPTEGHP